MHSHRKRGQAFGFGSSASALIGILLMFVDLATNSQMLGLAAAAMSIPYVNPPPKNDGAKRVSVTPVPLFIRLRWGDGLPHDLDLWVRCYSIVDGLKSNEITIGFKRTSQGWLDLLRDDQGLPSYLNEEQAQSNSEVSQVPPNTSCIFNVHLYHSRGGKIPVDAQLVVIQNKDSMDGERLVGDVKLTFRLPGQEVTGLMAQWDDHSNLIVDSVQKFPDAPMTYIATTK
jgi:hypothetical protein